MSSSLILIPTNDPASHSQFIIGHAGLSPVAITGHVRLLNNTKKHRYYTSVQIELLGTMKTSFYVPVHPYFFADSRIASRKVDLIIQPPENTPNRQVKFIGIGPGEFKDIPFLINFTTPEARALRPSLECTFYKDSNNNALNRSNSNAKQNEDVAFVNYTLNARATHQQTPPFRAKRFLSSLFGIGSSNISHEKISNPIIMKRYDLQILKELRSSCGPNTWSDKNENVFYRIAVNRTIVKPGGKIMFRYDVKSQNPALWVESVRFVIVEANMIRGVGAEGVEKMQVDRSRNVIVWEARAVDQDQSLRPEEIEIEIPPTPYNSTSSKTKSINHSGKFGIIEIEHTIKVFVTLRPRQREYANFGSPVTPNNRHSMMFSGSKRNSMAMPNVNRSSSARNSIAMSPNSYRDSYASSGQRESVLGTSFSNRRTSMMSSPRMSIAEEPLEIEVGVGLVVVPYDEDDIAILEEMYPELTIGDGENVTLPRYSPVQPPPAVVPDDRRFTFYAD